MPINELWPINPYPGKLVYMPFDVTEADKAQSFVEQAEAELGEIHGLVSE